MRNPGRQGQKSREKKVQNPRKLGKKIHENEVKKSKEIKVKNPRKLKSKIQGN